MVLLYTVQWFIKIRNSACVRVVYWYEPLEMFRIWFKVNNVQVLVHFYEYFFQFCLHTFKVSDAEVVWLNSRKIPLYIRESRMCYMI